MSTSVAFLLDNMEADAAFEFALLQQLYFNLEPYIFTHKTKIITISYSNHVCYRNFQKDHLTDRSYFMYLIVHIEIILFANSDNEVSYRIDRFIY